MEQSEPESLQPSPRLHFLARLTAVCTAVLIFAGALVTTTGSGLSVPDWPLSFGTLFPPMVGGVRFEHTHRLIAGSVAILTVVLCASFMKHERRRSVRIIAGLAVVSVLLQALLGGLTVLLRLPPPVSVAHGTLAQTFFCLVIALAVMTSPRWSEALPLPPSDGGPPRNLSLLRTVSLVTTGLIWAQLVIGATMRHLHAGLAIPDFPLNFGGIVPVFWSPMIAVNYLHRLMALGVLVFSTGTFVLVRRASLGHLPPGRASTRLLHLVLAQVLLGASVVWTTRSVIVTSLHVLNGALVLTASLALTLWIFRLTSGEAAEQRALPVGGPLMAGGPAA